MKFSATVTLQYDTIFSSFSHEEYLKGLDWMQQSCLDGAELCISSYSDIDLGRVKAELDERGLGCSTISTGQARGIEGLSLIGVPADITKRTQEWFMQHIDAAKVLGSKVTIGLMRGLGSLETMDRDLADLSEAMKPLVAYADQKGVTLNSAEATMDFIVNDLGNPGCVGILWDLFHANIEDIGFKQSIDIMGSRLQHVHLADSNRRTQGYIRALMEKGVEFDPSLIFYGDYDLSSGVRGAEYLLKKDVTAIFAYNDMSAYGVFHYLKQQGISVPEDISLIGYDDIFFSEILSVPLTSIHQPVEEMGTEAVQQMIRIIRQKQKQDTKKNIMFQPYLVVRQSTAAPAGVMHI